MHPKQFFATVAAALALCAVLAAGLVAAPTAEAQEITIVSWGGGWQDAQRVIIFKPFEKETGIRINEVSYDGELGRIKAMVISGNVEWDIVDVEWGTANILCEAGLAELIPDSFWDEVGGKDQFHPAAIHECGAGNFFWSTTFAYDANRIPPEQAAKTWMDFWDVKNFPGARSMRRKPKGNLEFALMADGVPFDQIYDVLRTPEGIDRAFRKLDEIKPHVKKWWEAGALPPQLLADGEVAYTTVYNGRITDANLKAGQNLRNVWWGNNYTLDLYVIPRGSPNKDLALKWIAYSLRKDRQTAFANEIPYGPVRYESIPDVNAEMIPELPSAPENMKHSLIVDEEYWAEHLEPLTERFEAWLTR